jgi:hypothetical protein
MERLPIKTFDGEDVYYTLDPNADDTGLGLGTIPITDMIVSRLACIAADDLHYITLSKKEQNDLSACNLSVNDLMGKYFDKSGFIYFREDKEIYKFALQIVYFKKVYKSKVGKNGITLNDILTFASKHIKQYDLLHDSPEKQEFSDDIAYCAKEKVASFEASYKKISPRMEQYSKKVNTSNRDLLIKVVGIIDVSMDIHSTLHTVERQEVKYKACDGILQSSIKIIQEIYCLLYNGFADGALARWRSLFENYVTTKLLLEFDEETAQMFMEHDTIIKNQLINLMTKTVLHVNRNDSFLDEYNALLKKYGNDFKAENGWLIKKFPNYADRQFTKLSEHVGTGEWNYCYKMACDYIHTNTLSAFEPLGKINGAYPLGPSETGLTIPANLTMTFMLFQLTVMVETFMDKHTALGLFFKHYLLSIAQILGLAENQLYGVIQ